MKKILTLLVAIFAFATLSFSQENGHFTAQAGYSWTMGMVGGEYQLGYIAVGAGHMPTSMPGSGEKINSFSAYFALTGYEYDESGYYLSLGFASAGYRHQTRYGSGLWENDIVSPMGIVNIGYKLQWYSGLNIKTEVGYGWCDEANVFTWGITAGWTFGM